MDNNAIFISCFAEAYQRIGTFKRAGMGSAFFRYLCMHGGATKVRFGVRNVSMDHIPIIPNKNSPLQRSLNVNGIGGPSGTRTQDTRLKRPLL